MTNRNNRWNGQRAKARGQKPSKGGHVGWKCQQMPRREPTEATETKSREGQRAWCHDGPGRGNITKFSVFIDRIEPRTIRPIAESQMRDPNKNPWRRTDQLRTRRSRKQIRPQTAPSETSSAAPEIRESSNWHTVAQGTATANRERPCPAKPEPLFLPSENNERECYNSGPHPLRRWMVGLSHEKCFADPRIAWSTLPTFQRNPHYEEPAQNSSRFNSERKQRNPNEVRTSHRNFDRLCGWRMALSCYLGSVEEGRHSRRFIRQTMTRNSNDKQTAEELASPAKSLHITSKPTNDGLGLTRWMADDGWQSESGLTGARPRQQMQYH